MKSDEQPWVDHWPMSDEALSKIRAPRMAQTMTEQQRLAIRLAADLGVDQREVDRAIALARTGRIDLIVAVSAKRLSIRAALQQATNDRARRTPRKRVT
jgi:acetyl-CoA carboxylase carboxyltransferase component